LDFIETFINERDYAPSYEEIAEGLGLSSVSTIYVHVLNLIDKGYLTKRWNANRSLDLVQVTERTPEAAQVPLVGRIAAGLPIEAIEVPESLGLPAEMLGKRETYVLQVKGDSMSDDHVLDGDYVIVEKRDWADDGEMVVALIRNSEATLKRLRRVGNQVKLEPANPAYKPIIVPAKEVSIQGVVIGILRKYKK
jgi:repressor LexA